MSSISGVSSAATASFAVAQTPVANPQGPQQSLAPVQSNSSAGLDSDGDHDGGRIDVSA